MTTAFLSERRDETIMPMTTIKTVDADGNLLNVRRMFMQTSDADLTDFKKKEDLEDLNEELENLSKIENDLLDLAIKRRTSIKNLERKINCSLDGLLGNWKAIEIIHMAWSKFGRSSEIVKEAVSRVRRCLFDDSLPQFKNIVFTSMKLDYNYSVATNYLRMEFCRNDFDPSTTFTIWIPLAGKIIYNWKYGCSSRGYIVTKSSKNYYDKYSQQITVAISPRLVTIAKAIKQLVVDGKEDFSSKIDEVAIDSDLRNDIVSMVMTGSLAKSMNEY